MKHLLIQKRNEAPPAKKEELPEKAPGKGEKGGPPA